MPWSKKPTTLGSERRERCYWQRRKNVLAVCKTAETKGNFRGIPVSDLRHLSSPNFCSTWWIKQAVKPRAARSYVGSEERKKYFFLPIPNPSLCTIVICIILPSLWASDLMEKVRLHKVYIYSFIKGPPRWNSISVNQFSAKNWKVTFIGNHLMSVMVLTVTPALNLYGLSSPLCLIWDFQTILLAP